MSKNMHAAREGMRQALHLKQAAEAQRVLSNTEASRYLNVSESWLNRRRCYGGGPAHLRLGRRIAYLQTDLDAYLEAQRHMPKDQVGKIAA